MASRVHVPQDVVVLAPGAENNGFASMLAELLRQNFEAKPHKLKDLRALTGSVALVADDAEIAVTLEFLGDRLVVHDGIRNVPDVTMRGSADTLMAMSNMPVRYGLPIPRRDEPEEMALVTDIFAQMRSGAFKSYGSLFRPAFLLRLTRVMSVNG